MNTWRLDLLDEATRASGNEEWRSVEGPVTAEELVGAVSLGWKDHSVTMDAHGRPQPGPAYELLVDSRNPYKTWRRYRDGTVLRIFSTEPAKKNESLGTVPRRPPARLFTFMESPAPKPEPPPDDPLAAISDEQLRRAIAEAIAAGKRWGRRKAFRPRNLRYWRMADGGIWLLDEAAGARARAAGAVPVDRHGNEVEEHA